MPLEFCACPTVGELRVRAGVYHCSTCGLALPAIDDASEPDLWRAGEPAECADCLGPWAEGHACPLGLPPLLPLVLPDLGLALDAFNRVTQAALDNVVRSIVGQSEAAPEAKVLRVVGDCRAQHPDNGYGCCLTADHPGDHQAFSSDDDPLDGVTWSDPPVRVPAGILGPGFWAAVRAATEKGHADV